LEEDRVRALAEFLQSGADHNLLPWTCQLAAAEQFCVSPAEVDMTFDEIALCCEGGQEPGCPPMTMPAD
jgi:hypothetical protein